jgi:hypothetical protein
MRRKSVIMAIAVTSALIVGWLAWREGRDRVYKQRAYSVVKELGGRIGSITPPVPFSGSDIRIEFHNVEFRAGDLERLSVLQPLSSRNHVGVMFRDTNVLGRDILELRAMLPKCRFFRVVAGELQNDH